MPPGARGPCVRCADRDGHDGVHSRPEGPRTRASPAATQAVPVPRRIVAGALLCRLLLASPGMRAQRLAELLAVADLAAPDPLWQR